MADPADPAQHAPPRRHGRGCGYEHQPRLRAANAALGAALHRLARDPDPAARAAGADLAAAVADLVETAAAAAADSTTRARRAGADAARMLARVDRVLVDLDTARARLRSRAEATR